MCRMSGRQDPVTKQFLLLKSIALASWDATLMTYNDTMVPWYMIRVARVPSNAGRMQVSMVVFHS